MPKPGFTPALIVLALIWQMQLKTCQADNCAAGSEPNLSGTMEYPMAGILLEDGPLVRLRNGSNQQVTFSSEDVDLGVIEGRVEVLSGGVWGTISDELFEYADAAVLCRELAAEQGYVATYVDDLSRDEVPSAPSSTTPVVWWKLGCNGNEEHVADCSKFNYPARADGIYDHSKDAGIYCILESPQECVQCVAGKYQDSPTVSVNMCKNCPDGKLSPAGASSLSQCALCPQGTRGTQDDQGVPICEDCNDNSSSNQDRTACECDPGYEDRSLKGIELPDTSNIRLRTAAGSSPIFDEYEKVSGRIEFRAGFLWGSIKQTSANPWDDFNALVACKEIAAENGYDYVSANVLTLEATPDGSTDQLYEGFACTGSESTLDSCPRSSASSPKDPSLNVGIECSFYVSHWDGDCSPCQAGQYSDSPGMPCTPCEEGKFATSSATQTCTDCPAGKASGTAGATDPIVCGLCGGGTYSLAAASECESCPSGKYSSASGTELNVACTDCSPGKVSSGGLAECSPCTSGHFQPLAGKGSCESCDAPFEVDASKVDCSCPAGTTDVYPSGRIGDAGTLRLRDASNAAPNFGVVGAGTVQGRVEVIPSGKASFGTISAESEWDNNAAHVACHQLGDALGYMLLSALPTTALETPDAGTDGSFIGQFWGDLECEGSEDYLQLCEGSSNYLAEDDLDHTKDVGVTCAYYPIQCQAGGDGTTPTPSPTMNPTPAPTDPESTSCPVGYDCRGGSPVACVAGKYSKGTLTGACLDCPVGSKCVGGAGKQPCQAGEYQSLVAQDFCHICEKGAYNPNRGQTSCTPCPLGTYNNDDGEKRLSHNNLSDCTLCATGKYSSAAGSSVCSNCAAGKSNGEAGSTLATQCEICGKGKYAVSGYECTDCPAGKFLDDARTAESYHDSPDDCFICGIGKYQSNVASTDCVVCPKGTYNNDNAVVSAHHDSVDDCIVCPAGTYNAEAADAASKHDDVNDCVVCSSGKYLPDEATSAELHDSADDCIACGAGKKNEDEGAKAENHDSPLDCTNCEPNFFSNDSTGTSSCVACAEGKFSVGGSGTCSNCPPGFTCTYADEGTANAGQLLSTAPCPLGKYSQTGEVCISCEKGFRCPGGTNQMECNQGEHQPSTEQSTCLPCKAGTYQMIPGQETCEICPEGYFCPKQTKTPIECGSVSSFCTAGSITPLLAQAGKYTTPDSVESEETRTAASFCPSGYACRGGVKTSCVAGVTFQPDAGKSSCNVCSSCGPGKYVAMECTISSDRICESCPGGSASLGGQTECSECGDGKPTNNETSASICTTCPQYEELDLLYGYSVTACKCMPSFVRRLKNESCSCTPGHTLTGEECSPCEVGRFKDDYGVHSCSRCEDVLKNSVTLSKNSTTASECVCPAGKFDNLLGGSARMCEPVKKGMSTTVEAMTLSTVTVEPGFWRVGPQSIDIRQCPVSDACPGGNSSNYCREGHEGPYCNLCEPDYTKDPFQICQTCSSTTEDVVKSIMVITAILTFTGLIFYYAHKKHLGANTNYDRKKLSKRFKNGFKIIFTGAQITSALPAVIPVLALPQNFKRIVESAQFLNLNIFQFVAVGCWSSGFNFYNRLIGTTVPIVVICLSLTTLAQFLPDRKARLNNIAVAITYLTLPTVTTTIFAMFPCDSIDGGQSYLRADYSISCKAEDRMVWQAYGLAMIAVFPLGITLLYCRLLWVDRRKIQLPIEEREKDLELMAEAFLFEPYKPEFWYFEVVETIRRLCLTGVLSAVAPGSFSQLSIGLLMSIFFTTVFCKLEPYHEPRDNKIAILSSWQLVLVFLCSYFMKSASLLTNSVDDSADFEFMGYLLIFSFIAIIILFVIYAIEQKDDFSEDAEEMAERILAEQSKSTMNMSLASLGSLKSISNMNSSSSRKVSFAVSNPMQGDAVGGERESGGGGDGGGGLQMRQLGGAVKGRVGGRGRGRGRGGGGGSGVWKSQNKSTPMQSTIVGKSGTLEATRISPVNELNQEDGGNDDDEHDEVQGAGVGDSVHPHDSSMSKEKREEVFFAKQREKAKQEKEQEAKQMGQMTMLEREKYEKELLQKNEHDNAKSKHMQRLSMNFRGGATRGRGRGRGGGGRGRGGGK